MPPSSVAEVNALCFVEPIVPIVVLLKDKTKVLAVESEGNLYQVESAVLPSIYVKH